MPIPEPYDQPAQIRVLPADEQEKMLDARYQEASERVAEGERLIAEWQPVVQSCRAGLQALREAQEQATKSLSG